MSAERDEVLWRFAQETGASPDCVEEWAKRYPEHADAILALSLYRDIIPEASDDEAVAFREAVALQEAAGPVARSMLDAMRARRNLGGLSSIVDTARERGIAPRDLARVLRIGMSVLTRLERRLLEPETVPVTLVRAMGDAVGASAGAVMAYLRQPPTLSVAASYRARGKVRLQVAEPRGPIAAVSHSMDTTAMHRVREYLRPKDDRIRSDADDMPEEQAAEGDADQEAVVRLAFDQAVRDAPDMADADKAVWLVPNTEDT